MDTNRTAAIWRVARRLRGRLGRGSCAALLLVAAPPIAWADPPSDPPASGHFALAATSAQAGPAGLEELSDAQLDDVRGRALACKPGTTQRRRVILWDEHRSIEILGPLGSADPRNQIQTSAGRVEPVGMLLP